jgi:hypothetical protein
MNRTARIVVAALALLLVVVATAIGAPSERARDRMAPVAASHQPQTETETEDGPPSAEQLARLVDRLAAAGITTDEATLSDLAADHGVGGAVRLVAWAHASGRSTGDLIAMFDAGMGWGEIAKELGGDIHPGIGWIMGGGPPAHAQGFGRAGAPGQQDR